MGWRMTWTKPSLYPSRLHMPPQNQGAFFLPLLASVSPLYTPHPNPSQEITKKETFPQRKKGLSGRHAGVGKGPFYSDKAPLVSVN